MLGMSLAHAVSVLRWQVLSLRCLPAICSLMSGTLEMVMLPHLPPRVSVEVNGEKKKRIAGQNVIVLLDGREVPRMDPGETAYTMGTAIEDTEGR